MHHRQHLIGPTQQPPRDSPQLQRVDLQLPDRQFIKVNAQHRLDVRGQRAGHNPNITEHGGEHKHEKGLWTGSLQ